MVDGKKLRECPAPLARMLSIARSYERESVEETIPASLWVENAGRLFVKQRDAGRYRPEIHLLNYLWDLDDWIESLPQDIRDWIREETGPFPENPILLGHATRPEDTEANPESDEEKDAGKRDQTPNTEAPEPRRIFTQEYPTAMQRMKASTTEDSASPDAVGEWRERLVFRVVLLRRACRIIQELIEKRHASVAAGWDISSGYEPDWKGVLRLVIPEPEKYLQQVFVGAEVERVRRCVVCGDIFWAGRLDQSACSGKCATSHRVRTHRKKKGGRS